MKIHSRLLTLCIFQPAILRTAAFSIQSPTLQFTSALHSTLSNGGGLSYGGTGSLSYDANISYGGEAGNAVVLKRAASAETEAADRQLQDNMDSLVPSKIQGGALKTWAFQNPDQKRLLVSLTTEEDRGINAQIELCEGPANIPQQLDITIGKGMLRPFKAVIETPGGHSSLFLRNTGPLEYPITAGVGAEIGGVDNIMEDANSDYSSNLLVDSQSLYDSDSTRIMQGGSVHSVKFEPCVQSAKVVLQTDGRPLNARIELINGPNSVRETIDLYTEDGLERPFLTIISTPGSGNTIRIINTASMEFPLTVSLDPFMVDADSEEAL